MTMTTLLQTAPQTVALPRRAVVQPFLPTLRLWTFFDPLRRLEEELDRLAHEQRRLQDEADALREPALYD